MTRFTVLQAIDNLVRDLEEEGFTEREVIEAMAEYLEIVDDLARV